jgi:hypothetical protein
LRALEHVRLDAADGKMDDLIDEDKAIKLQQARVDGVHESELDPVPEHELWAAAEKERGKLAPRYGLHMRALIIWDVGVFGALVHGGPREGTQARTHHPWCTHRAAWGGHGARSAAHAAHGRLARQVALYAPRMLCRQHDWMLWTNLFYANITHSVLMLPFLMLIIPVVSTMITDATPTGYDKAGHLGGVLSTAMMERKKEQERETGARASSVAEHDDEHGRPPQSLHNEDADRAGAEARRQATRRNKLSRLRSVASSISMELQEQQGQSEERVRGRRSI